MDFLERVKDQLKKMSEAEKDTWILSHAKLISGDEMTDFLMSLTGEKRVISLPSMGEIDEFCEKVKNANLYFEYETHYYEFDDDGRYMDDWKVWYWDPFHITEFMDRIFLGCHDLFRLEEYQTVMDIYNKIGDLRFKLETSENSEDDSESETFTLTEADKEGMFLMRLEDAGYDWIRAAARLLDQKCVKESAGELKRILEHPFCNGLRPNLLLEEDISQDIFLEMADEFESEVTALEYQTKDMSWSYEKFEKSKTLHRKQEILSDLQFKCIKRIAHQEQEVGLRGKWKRILEIIKWLSYEYIDDNPEIDEIQDICEELCKSDEVQKEEWEVRKKVLEDIIRNVYYERYNCIDQMRELAQKLCNKPEEYLVMADLLNEHPMYEYEAACLYHKYGRDDKYVSYLENRLGKRSKEYSALIAFYQEKGQEHEAVRVAELGLEQCREDLTDCFICLLNYTKREQNETYYKKLLASAKRRKHVDLEKIRATLK